MIIDIINKKANKYELTKEETRNYFYRILKR